MCKVKKKKKIKSVCAHRVWETHRVTVFGDNERNKEKLDNKKFACSDRQRLQRHTRLSFFFSISRNDRRIKINPEKKKRRGNHHHQSIPPPLFLVHTHTEIIAKPSTQEKKTGISPFLFEIK